MVNLISFISRLFGKKKPPSKSPLKKTTLLVAGTTIRIAYKSPSAKGRKIMGQLVPYGQIWRTGAGYCTTITFAKAVYINNKCIAAGSYAMFTIPGPAEWTIILNTAYKQFGIAQYDSAFDAIRITVKAEVTDTFYEALFIGATAAGSLADITIAWETTRVSFTICLNPHCD